MSERKIMQLEVEENNEFSHIIRNKAHIDSPAFNALRLSSGDFKIPYEFRKKLDATLKKENIFRTYGTVTYTSQSQNLVVTSLSTGEADIVGEKELYPESGDTLECGKSRASKIGAVVKLNNAFVYDIKFNVENYLKNEFAQRFGRAEEKYFINGTGNGQPTGILAKEADITSFEEGVLTYEDVVSLYFSVKDKYARNGVFVVNRKTAMALRTMLDNNGNPIWNINDNTIFSKPVLISEYMPDIESGSKPIFFGDLSYYWILILEPLRLRVLTEMFATEDAIGYTGYERLDGRLINDEAVAVLQIQ